MSCLPRPKLLFSILFYYIPCQDHGVASCFPRPKLLFSLLFYYIPCQDHGVASCFPRPKLLFSQVKELRVLQKAAAGVIKRDTNTFL